MMRHLWQKLAWIVLFVATLVVSLWLCIPATTAQPRFADVVDHWAQPCIESLAEQRILSGFPDGRFRPDADVTRAQFAAMLLQAFPDAPLTQPDRRFADVPSRFWAATAIQRGVQSGFLAGFPDGRFRPNQPVLRVQTWVALSQGKNLNASQPIAPSLRLYQDADRIPTYAKPAVAAATEQQWVVNYPNPQALQPNAAASRADVAALLCQALPQSRGLLSVQFIPRAQPIRQEIRGVWLTNIDSEVLFKADRVRSVIQELSQHHLNTLYPTVWNWGYTLYPSRVMQQTIGLALDPRPAGLQGRDVLKELVTEGHRHGLAVIPWFEFGLMAPADSELLARHPDWFTQHQNGSRVWLEGADPRVWLNPFKPEAQQFLLALIREIVANYDVDGIQFDDHLGLPVEFGYDNFTIALYKQEHNNQPPPTDGTDPDWMRWRADKITAFMTQIFQTIKATKPVLVALSPNPQDFAYSQFLQDWHRWEHQGLIEELIVQLYRYDISKFRADLTDPTLVMARDHIPTGIGILTGLKGKQVPMTQIQQQVQAVRDRGYAGVSFFFYETLWNLVAEPAEQRQAAFKTLLTPPVPRQQL
jgi:uncharacterized lipoprotein YddW (UPF0748 family)